MAVFSHRYNYLFFTAPLSGAQAINRVLLADLEGVPFPPEDVVRNGKIVARKQWTTYKMIKMAELLSQEELDQAFKVTIVRNPFDLLAARYQKRLGDLNDGSKKGKKLKVSSSPAIPAPSFHQWLLETHQEMVANDTKARAQLAFTEKANLVIRFEALQSGFDQFLSRIGLDRSIQLYPDPSKPAPQSVDYANLYSAEDVALVEKLYSPILETFGYTFSGGSDA